MPPKKTNPPQYTSLIHLLFSKPTPHLFGNPRPTVSRNLPLYIPQLLAPPTNAQYIAAPPSPSPAPTPTPDTPPSAYPHSYAQPRPYICGQLKHFVDTASTATPASEAIAWNNFDAKPTPATLSSWIQSILQNTPSDHPSEITRHLSLRQPFSAPHLKLALEISSPSPALIQLHLFDLVRAFQHSDSTRSASRALHTLERYLSTPSSNPAIPRLFQAANRHTPDDLNPALGIIEFIIHHTNYSSFSSIPHTNYSSFAEWLHTLFLAFVPQDHTHLHFLCTWLFRMSKKPTAHPLFPSALAHAIHHCSQPHLGAGTQARANIAASWLQLHRANSAATPELPPDLLAPLGTALPSYCHYDFTWLSGYPATNQWPAPELHPQTLARLKNHHIQTALSLKFPPSPVPFKNRHLLLEHISKQSDTYLQLKNLVSWLNTGPISIQNLPLLYKIQERHNYRPLQDLLSNSQSIAHIISKASRHDLHHFGTTTPLPSDSALTPLLQALRTQSPQSAPALAPLLYRLLLNRPASPALAITPLSDHHLWFQPLHTHPLHTLHLLLLALATNPSSPSLVSNSLQFLHQCASPDLPLPLLFRLWRLTTHATIPLPSLHPLWTQIQPQLFSNIPLLQYPSRWLFRVASSLINQQQLSTPR